MARIYSWFLRDNTYAYISNPTSGKQNEAYVGRQLSSEETQKVSDWTSTASEDEYRRNFEDLKQKTSSYGVKFESVEAYLNVVQGCTNLRGPKGRSLNKIEAGGEVTNDDGTFITYWVTFDDGAQDYFLMPKPKDGADGKPGATGAKADSPIASRVVFAYRSGLDEHGNILSEIPTPTGGKWDYVTNTVTYPEGWFANDGELAPPIWMSTRTFASTQASTDLKWSKPQQITGENGLPGEDGANMEFIYLRQNVKPSIPQNSENKPNYVPNNWSDSPMGVDEDNTTEWYCVRTYNKQTKTWGAWGTVNIWSKYGTNGQDGDGVQYIFLLNNGVVPANPTPEDWEDNEDYQNKNGEWIPNDGYYQNINGDEILQTPDNAELSGNTPNRWYDNAPNVNIDNQYLWVAQRKYKLNTNTNEKQWEVFSNPSLWAKFGADGAPGTNATSIRRLYALSNSTSNPPGLPGNSLYTNDWGTGYPKDYEPGENVVWCTEAEVWAHNYAFVERYVLVSITDDNGNISAPSDADRNNNTLEVVEIPETKNEDYKYLKLNEGGQITGYYEWKSGWSTPFIVSGLKGNDVKPIDYTTYVFGYGWVDSMPEKPNGTSSENPGTSYDKNGNLVEWMDYPDVTIGTDNGVRRWYQCVGYVDGYNSSIKEWGNVLPCNGSDGVGNYMEFRFGVTYDNNKPTLNVFSDNPELIIDGEKTGWFSTDENLPDIPVGGAMWQIWGLKDGKTDTLVPGNKWNGPTKISGEKGETGLQGPAGLRGITGIPGSKKENMYCLGTLNYPFADLGDADLNMDIPPYYKSVMETMNWFNNKNMPSSDIIDVYNNTNELPDYNHVKYGQVYRIVNTQGSKTYHTYYLALSNNKHEQAYRNRTSGDTLLLSTLPSFKIDENEVKYIKVGKGDNTTLYTWDNNENNGNGGYVLKGVENDSTPTNTIHMAECPSSKLDTTNKQFIIVGEIRYVWDLSNNSYVSSEDKEILIINDNVLYYRLLRGPILKDKDYNIYIWSTEGSEVYGVANRESYTAYKPNNATNSNTITITSDNLPRVKINNETLFKKGVNYFKYDNGYINATSEDIKNNSYVIVNELPNIAPNSCEFIEHYNENRVIGYYTFNENHYKCVIPDNITNNVYSGNTIPTENNVDKDYFQLIRNNNTIGYFKWTTNDGDDVSHSLLGIDWSKPYKLQGTNGLRGIAGNRGQVVYPMGTYNSEEVYITDESRAPYVYDPGDSMFYVYNKVGEPWVGLLPGGIINNGSDEYLRNDDETIINSGIYKTYVSHPKEATTANTYTTTITGVTSDTYTYPSDASDNNTSGVTTIPSSKITNNTIKYLKKGNEYYEWDSNKKEYKQISNTYIILKQKITHINDIGVKDYNKDNNTASETYENGQKEFVYDVDVYLKREGGTNIYNLASVYKYSKSGKAFDGFWMTDQNGITPSTNYANLSDNGYEPAWNRFESFQALFANVGIIANGLIGSAVFNNEFMFSQQGAKQELDYNNKYVEHPDSNYENFISAYHYDEDGLVKIKDINNNTKYCKKSKVKAGETILEERHWCYAQKNDRNEKSPFVDGLPNRSICGDTKYYEVQFKSFYLTEGRVDPYAKLSDIKNREDYKNDSLSAETKSAITQYISYLSNENIKEDSQYIHKFLPNICINFASGQLWAQRGEIKFGYNDNGEDIGTLSQVNKSFGKTTIDGGLVLSNFIGVNDDEENTLKAFFNGVNSKFTINVNDNEEDIFIAGGIPSCTSDTISVLELIEGLSPFNENETNSGTSVFIKESDYNEYKKEYITVDNYEMAINSASTLNEGSLIKVKNDSTYNGPIYQKGFYIVDNYKNISFKERNFIVNIKEELYCKTGNLLPLYPEYDELFNYGIVKIEYSDDGQTWSIFKDEFKEKDNLYIRLYKYTGDTNMTTSLYDNVYTAATEDVKNLDEGYLYYTTDGEVCYKENGSLNKYTTADKDIRYYKLKENKYWIRHLYYDITTEKIKLLTKEKSIDVNKVLFSSFIVTSNGTLINNDIISNNVKVKNIDSNVSIESPIITNGSIEKATFTNISENFNVIINDNDDTDYTQGFKYHYITNINRDHWSNGSNGYLIFEANGNYINTSSENGWNKTSMDKQFEKPAPLSGLIPISSGDTITTPSIHYFDEIDFYNGSDGKLIQRSMCRITLCFYNKDKQLITSVENSENNYDIYNNRELVIYEDAKGDDIWQGYADWIHMHNTSINKKDFVLSSVTTSEEIKFCELRLYHALALPDRWLKGKTHSQTTRFTFNSPLIIKSREGFNGSNFIINKKNTIIGYGNNQLLINESGIYLQVQTNSNTLTKYRFENGSFIK